MNRTAWTKRILKQPVAIVVSPHLYMQDILQATCLRMAKYLQGIYVSGKLLQKWTRVGGGRGRSKLLQVALSWFVYFLQ